MPEEISTVNSSFHYLSGKDRNWKVCWNKESKRCKLWPKDHQKERQEMVLGFNLQHERTSFPWISNITKLFPGNNCLFERNVVIKKNEKQLWNDC